MLKPPGQWEYRALWDMQLYMQGQLGLQCLKPRLYWLNRLMSMLYSAGFILHYTASHDVQLPWLTASVCCLVLCMECITTTRHFSMSYWITAALLVVCFASCLSLRLVACCATVTESAILHACWCAVILARIASAVLCSCCSMACKTYWWWAIPMTAQVKMNNDNNSNNTNLLHVV